MKYLLMGGQACVLYGAAQFSKDVDFALLASDSNLENLKKALLELEAKVVAVPPFEKKYLDMGLFVHFRCQRDDVKGLRIDIGSKLRGSESFETIYENRTELLFPDQQKIYLVGIEDLVKIKKTQRPKDWPMLESLVQSHYFKHKKNPNKEQLAFWAKEARTLSILKELIDISQNEPVLHLELEKRNLIGASEDKIIEILQEEKNQEMSQDRAYWAPLRKELEELRKKSRNSSSNQT